MMECSGNSVENSNCGFALVFSGGLGLASYHAGAFEAFWQRSLTPSWVTGASAGSIAAALIAGNAERERIESFRSFWDLPEPAAMARHPWRHLQGWASAVRTHLLGAAGQFEPRIPSLNPYYFRSLYELTPMRERLSRLIDFGRLNGGEIRISVATTDVETGDPVVFDSKHCRIEMDHLLASCGFLPEFAPVKIGDRLLVDGGLSINAPFDPIFEELNSEKHAVFVIDLYARDGGRPCTLERAAERKNDLLFGNQTFLRLRDKVKLRRLEKAAPHDVYLLSYRTGPAEPGPEKSFNFSKHAISERWDAGFLDMQYALTGSSAEIEGIKIVRRTVNGKVTP